MLGFTIYTDIFDMEVKEKTPKNLNLVLMITDDRKQEKW